MVLTVPRAGDRQVGMCDGCHYGPVLLTAYPRHDKLDLLALKWLCHLCAHTPLGVLIDTSKAGTDLAALQTLCYVGNAILARLEQATR
jgi:hypothetical protein